MAKSSNLDLVGVQLNDSNNVGDSNGRPVQWYTFKLAVTWGV